MEKKEISFEEIMKQLEQVTSELEKGDLNLEDAVKKFELGMELSKRANEILEKLEKRITILIENDGQLKEENFVQAEE
mgnify:FL=1